MQHIATSKSTVAASTLPIELGAGSALDLHQDGSDFKNVLSDAKLLGNDISQPPYSSNRTKTDDPYNDKTKVKNKAETNTGHQKEIETESTSSPTNDDEQPVSSKNGLSVTENTPTDNNKQASSISTQKGIPDNIQDSIQDNTQANIQEKNIQENVKNDSEVDWVAFVDNVLSEENQPLIGDLVPSGNHPETTNNEENSHVVFETTDIVVDLKTSVNQESFPSNEDYYSNYYDDKDIANLNTDTQYLVLDGVDTDKLVENISSIPLPLPVIRSEFDLSASERLTEDNQFILTEDELAELNGTKILNNNSDIIDDALNSTVAISKNAASETETETSNVIEQLAVDLINIVDLGQIQDEQSFAEERTVELEELELEISELGETQLDTELALYSDVLLLTNLLTNTSSNTSERLGSSANNLPGLATTAPIQALESDSAINLTETNIEALTANVVSVLPESADKHALITSLQVGITSTAAQATSEQNNIREGLNLKDIVESTLSAEQINLTDEQHTAITEQAVKAEQLLTLAQSVVEGASNQGNTALNAVLSSGLIPTQPSNNDVSLNATFDNLVLEGEVKVAEQSKIITPTSLERPIPVHQPEGQKQIAEKIRWMVGARVTAAEIRMDPPELGSMQIRVNLAGDTAAVSFIVQTVQAKEMLAEGQPRLREMLSEQGIDLGESSVSTQDEQQTKEQNEGGQGQQGVFASGLDDDITVSEQVIKVAQSAYNVDAYV